MPIRLISLKSSLDFCWTEIVFSLAMLEADTLARPLAVHLAPFEPRLEVLRTTQHSKWRAEIVADAKVAFADRSLDEVTTSFSSELLRFEQNEREAPRFKLYFKKAPHQVTRLGLKSQLEVCEGWPKMLPDEPEQSLKDFAKKFTDVMTLGNQALAAREEAITQTALQRARELNVFVDDLNAARQTTYGQLTSLASQHRRPRGWAESFFRVSESDNSPPAT